MSLPVERVEPQFFAGAVADEIIATIEDKSEGHFSIALAGGRTPGVVYRALTTSPRLDSVPWERLKIFIGDERWVEPDSPHSNFNMVKETCLNHIVKTQPQSFPVNLQASTAEDAAKEYAATLTKELSHNEAGIPIFDLVLLGLGSDGHIASIFPKTPAVVGGGAHVIVTVNPEDESTRISLSREVLLAAKRVLFMVRGEGKSVVLKKVWDGSESEDAIPAMMFKQRESVAWYVDSAAALKIPQ